MQSDWRCDGRLQMRLQLFHHANGSFMTSLWVIFSHRRALIINEGSHRIPPISWMAEVFFNGRQLSCRCGALPGMRGRSHASARIWEKRKLQCEEKQSGQNEGGRFFFLNCVFYDCKWGAARFFVFLVGGGGADTFTFLFLNSFFVTCCEVGRAARREARHQLALMFATWHILCYYTGFVFIFFSPEKLLWHISPIRRWY